MKKIMLLLAFALVGMTQINAQKIVYVDTDKVLSSLPEYQDAQAEVDRITERWQRQIEEKYQEIETLYRAYQAQEIVLSPSEKTEKEEEIVTKEKALKDFQKAKFGNDGELYEKRVELIRPIQEQVYEAIRDMASQRAYDFVLDKSSGVSILYANEEYDKTTDIMKKLGIEVAED